MSHTFKVILPREIAYLAQYDAFRTAVASRFEMPDKLIALLLRFLEQNQGQLSQRARHKEFNSLTTEELVYLEQAFEQAFRTG